MCRCFERVVNMLSLHSCGRLLLAALLLPMVPNHASILPAVSDASSAAADRGPPKAVNEYGVAGIAGSGSQDLGGATTSIPVASSGAQQSANASRRAGCDVTKGDWQLRNGSSPFDGHACALKLFGGEWGCRNKQHGRDFWAWDWVPTQCTLPRLTKEALTEQFGGQQVLLAGDSLVRNLFYTLACAVQASFGGSAVELQFGSPDDSESGARLKVLSVKEIGLRVEYRSAPYLVQPHGNLTTADKACFKDVDSFGIVLLNVGHWLSHLQQEPSVALASNRTAALQQIMSTVGKRLRAYKGRVFWLTYPPVHFSGSNWQSGKCNYNYPVNSASDPIATSDTAVMELRPVELRLVQLNKWRALDITGLSAVRPDAHPGHAVFQYHPKSRVMDCSHWCLGGVPNAWLQVWLHQLANGG